MPDWKSFSSAVPEILSIGLHLRRLVSNAGAARRHWRRAAGAWNCAHRANLASPLDIFSPRSEIGIGSPRLPTEQPHLCRRGDRSAAFRPQKRAFSKGRANFRTLFLLTHQTVGGGRRLGWLERTLQNARFCGLQAAPRPWGRLPAFRFGRHPCRPFRAGNVRRGRTRNTGQGCPVNRQAGMPAPHSRRGSTEAGTSRPRPLPGPIFLPPFFCRKNFRCADWFGGPRRRPVPAPAAPGPADSGFVPQPPSPGPCSTSARPSLYSLPRSAEDFRPPASPAGLMELGQGRKPKESYRPSGAMPMRKAARAPLPR